MKKYIDSIKSLLRRTFKSDGNIDSYVNENYEVHPFATSGRIAMTYGIVGALWIAFSDKVLDIFVNDVELYKTIELYKGWMYVWITTILVFLLVIKQLIQFETAIKKIQNNYTELNNYNEELLAMEEELKNQLEELDHNRKSLQTSEERYQLAVEGADCGIWDFDAINDIYFYSAKWKSDLGYEKGEVEDSFNGWVTLVHPEDREMAEHRLREFMLNRLGNVYDAHYRMKHKDGSYRWIHSKGKSVCDSNGSITRIAGSHMDITEQKNVEQKLEWLAYYDSLTELPNRVAFENRINAAIGNSKSNPFAFVYLDIDDFKNINDALGHVAGDYFLKHVANELRNNIPEQGFIARLSGDEFAILLDNISEKEEIEDRLKSVMELSKKPWNYMERELFFSFSAGVTRYPADGQDYFTLLKNADIAMYAAKKGMKNRYSFYSNEINIKNLKRIEMIHELRHALDNEEFELYYQPINCLDNEQVYGVEALIRWIHPDKGMVPPMEFIPLAEETGLIYEIDKWVLKTAFKQKETWEKKNEFPVKVSINISGKSFLSFNLLEILAELLEEIPVIREDIHIEITETAYMENIELAAEILEKISEMGVKIALDDFGTGYSSLTYLERLPIDIVKLDRKFIMNLMNADEESVIVQNLIKLTHDLKLLILAEGIETKEQLNFLQENGCDLGQGYLFSKPITVEAIQDYWQSREEVNI